MKPDLNQLEEWARGAGEILREGYEREHEVQFKSAINPVTEIDKRSEKYLIGQIRAHYDGHSIVTEESGYLNGTSSQNCWYIDPLDGTVNYAHGVPLFVVSLAYAENGKVKYGVVYDPMRDECFTAARGEGAFVNGRPLHVSNAEQLIQSLVVTGFPYERGAEQQRNLHLYSHLTGLTQGVRRLGAAAMDLAYVAAGRVDAFWELSLEPWDIAAGGLLVEEAGGVVTSTDGDAHYMKPRYSILAANPTLHSLVLKELSVIER
jgi:myo-inositol-1(or 4)-monophosphatase